MDLRCLGFCAVLFTIGVTGCQSVAPGKNEQGPDATTCYPEFKDLPEAWRPGVGLRASLSSAPWTDAEGATARDAVRVGYEEMSGYLTKHPEHVMPLWDNAVEAFVDIAYAGSNDPQLTADALGDAVRNFEVIAAPYGLPNPAHHDCSEAGNLLSLVVYGHTLAQRATIPQSLQDVLKVLTVKTNRAVASCGSLQGLLGYDPAPKFAATTTSNGDVYDLVMWSITIADALANPALTLPTGSQAFIGQVWRYLDTYPLPDAKTYKTKAEDGTFYDNAYLVTHAGYIPTGYGRYPLYRRDGEWLFRFLRANFYAVMEMGELDLLAEFVDLFRQYGCSEETDRQLRDGSRYLLRLFKAAGGSWMAHREPYESAEIGPYDLMHKPWTGMAGLRRRVVEPVAKGTYGAIVRQALSQ